MYLIKVNLCLLFLYAFYLIFLRKETSFNLNRAYLLVGLGLALGIPLLQIQVSPKVVPATFSRLQWQSLLVPDKVKPGKETVHAVPVPVRQEKRQATKTTVSAPLANAANKAPEPKTSLSFSWFELLTGLYITGIAFCLALFIYRFSKICRTIFRSKVMNKDDYKVVFTYGKLPMLSFFNYLFWDNTLKLTTEQREQIIAHETAHIRHRHTIDVLLMELFCIVFWYNPVVYWWRGALRENHEYVADKAVIEQQDAHSYAMLLLSQSLGSLPQFTLGNRLVQSQIKKRVNMMTKKTMTRKISWKYVLLIPMLACLGVGLGQVSFGQTPALATSSLVAHQLMTHKPKQVQTPVAVTSQAEKVQQKELIKEAIKRKIYEEIALLTPVLDTPGKKESKMRRISQGRNRSVYMNGDRDRRYHKMDSDDDHVYLEATIKGVDYNVNYNTKGKVIQLYVNSKEIKKNKFKKYRKTTDSMWQDWVSLKEGLKDLNVSLKDLGKNLSRDMKNLSKDLEINIGDILEGVLPVVNLSLNATGEILKDLKLDFGDLGKELKNSIKIDMKDLNKNLKLEMKELKEALKELKNLKIEFNDDDDN